MRNESLRSGAHASRVPELDGIRGLAIGSVMLFHFVYCQFTPQTAIDSVLSRATSYGFLGVDLFFVLSGYLITGILYDSKASTNYYRSFYVRRTLRIFPLYYAVLVITMWMIPEPLVMRFMPDLMQARAAQGWVWSYLTNVYIAHQGAFTIPYLSHFWTLAIEEHFYLFWPLVVALCSRARAQSVCLVLIGLALCLRVVFVELDFNGRYPQVLTPCRLDSICAGAWFALAAREQGTEDLAVRAKRLLMLAASAFVLCSSVPSMNNVVVNDVRLAVRGTVLAFFFGAVILFSTTEQAPRWLKACLSAAWLRTLGKYSYGLYVYHGILTYHMQQYDIAPAITQNFGTQSGAVLLKSGLAILVSLVVAVLSFELFEVRFLALKGYFEGSGKLAVLPPGPVANASEEPFKRRA